MQRRTVPLVLVAWLPILALFLTATVQTLRLIRRSEQLHEAREQLFVSSQANRALVETILEDIRRDIQEGVDNLGMGGEDYIYMIVDTDCTACGRAMRILSDIPIEAQVVVASFSDSPGEITDWLASHGASFPVLRKPIQETTLSRLPRGISPVFLEVEMGVPVDIHFGQPKERWLDQSARG